MRKAPTLFAKFNPPPLEWLGSPIVYREEPDFIADLKALLPNYYAPRACMYHYRLRLYNKLRVLPGLRQPNHYGHNLICTPSTMSGARRIAGYQAADPLA